MSNVKNITSKILKDAEVERDRILAASEEEKNKIISKSVKQKSGRGGCGNGML